MCVCVRSFCRQLFQNRHSGEFGATVITDMSIEGWKHSCHFLWSPEWVCVLYVYSCQRDLLARVCVHIVWRPVILLGWWKPNDRWCLREKLMWLEKRWCSDDPVHVCVLFSCKSLLGFQQWGTTRPYDEGCLYGPAYSLVSRKDDPPIKNMSRALWVLAVSLLNSLGPCLFDGWISISFITSSQFYTQWCSPLPTLVFSKIWCPGTEWNS